MKRTQQILCILLAAALLASCSPGGMRGKMEKFSISDEQPVAATKDGIQVDFGQFNGLGQGELSITPLGMEADGLGATITSYDFNVKGRSDFDGLLTVSLPYDPEKIMPGNEAGSVMGMYFDEELNDWVPTLYTVDTENKMVHITTDHLSKYCTVTIENENTPYARIAKVSGLQEMDASEASAIFEEYASLGQPGPLALEAGLSIASDYLGLADGLLTLSTIGGAIDAGTMGQLAAGGGGGAPLLDTLGDLSRHAGLGLAVTQLAFDLYRGDPQQTAINAYKNVISNAVSYFGTSAMQLGMVGVMAIDYSITQFANAAWQQHEDAIYRAVTYYNDVEAPRDLKTWRDMFMNLYERYKDDPARLAKSIDALMYNFSHRFFLLTDAEQAEVAAVAGMRALPYIYQNDRDGSTERYMAELGTRLQPVFEQLKGRMLLDIKQDYYDKLKALQKEMNKTATLALREATTDGASLYAGHTAAITKQSGAMPDAAWTMQLDGSGSASMDITALGYLQAGAPTIVDVYAPGQSAPVLSVEFALVAPRTEIALISAPSFEEILGVYEDGIVTVQNVQFSESLLESARESGGVTGIDGCESMSIASILVALQAAEGVPQPASFAFVKFGENTVRLHLDGDEMDVFALTYASGTLSASRSEDGNHVSSEFTCRYSEDRTRVNAEGGLVVDARMDEGRVYVELHFAGSKPITP